MIRAIRRHKCFLIAALLIAVSGALAFSIGGEYLHSMVHDHSDHAEAYCSYYYFQKQVFLLTGSVFFAFLIASASGTFFQSNRPKPTTFFLSHYLRAPPTNS